MKVLVCGGAGYIGSHMVRLLTEHGHEPVSLDNLATGHADAVGDTRLAVGNVLDDKFLDRVFSKYGPFDLVMHFCAMSQVGESVKKPELYFENNVTGTIRLLEAMRRHGHDRLVFSSSAAVYGVPQSESLDETHPCMPINPYGETKLEVEHALKEYHHSHGIRSLSFRYFNACGAHPGAEIGERHDPETHLVPNILGSLLHGGKPLYVFGDDYDTPDGSCIRDYIHVCDIVDAHLAAAGYLDNHDNAAAINLGNGSGFSVFEVIRAVEAVTGREVSFSVQGRREGDVPRLVADARLAREKLDWSPVYTKMESIIETAWRFHQRQAKV